MAAPTFCSVRSAAPVKVAMPALVVTDWTPGGRTPELADIVPEKVYELPPGANADPVADANVAVAGAAGTRPTLVVVTAGDAPPPPPLVAETAGGVAVTKETIGTVTAVVITVTVEERDMVCV